MTPEELTPDEFCLWLRGFIDALPNGLDEHDAEKVRDKLQSVMAARARKPWMPIPSPLSFNTDSISLEQQAKELAYQKQRLGQ